MKKYKTSAKKWNLQKRTKWNKELKDKMSDTYKNNLLDEFNIGREVMENRIRELEDISIEFTQSEQQKSVFLIFSFFF